MSALRRQTKRDLYLVMTLTGTLICLGCMAGAAFVVLDELPQWQIELATGNWRVIVGRAQMQAWPSVVFASVLAFTWLSFKGYRRHLQP